MAEDLRRRMMPELWQAVEAFSAAHPTCTISLRQREGVITKIEGTVVVAAVPRTPVSTNGRYTGDPQAR